MIILLILFGFLFFYHIDYNKLASWDEAWYGSISREIVKSNDFINLNWNGKPYFDHPPMGFWLMAGSQKILGTSEFSLRAPSALLGLFTIILIFALAKELFKNPLISFMSSLILGTSVWYVLRVRSGNLDAIFAFFYVLTIYLSIKSSRNFKFFPVTMGAFACLFLTKTLIGISALPLIIFTNWRQIMFRKNLSLVLIGISLFLIIVSPWYLYHLIKYPNFFNHHFVNIGSRNRNLTSYFDMTNFNQVMFYLHMGIRKWYYFWIFALVFILSTRLFFKKNVAFLLLWTITVLFPFLSSEKTEIWHLIPVYLPLSITTAYGLYSLIEYSFDFIKKLKITSFTYKRNLNTLYMTNLSFFCLVCLVAVFQIKTFKDEVIPKSLYTSDEVDISLKLKKFDKKIYFDDDFLPIAVFYSEKHLMPVSYIPSYKTLLGLFKSKEKDFVVVTRSWAVDGLKVNNLGYKVLAENKSFYIIGRNQ